MQEQEPGLTASNGGSPATDMQQDPAADTVPSLQERLQQAEAQAQEHYDGWLRAKAEADNIRKRAQADIANAHKYAVEGLAGDLLPVRDSLEAALAVDNSTLEALRQGVELTLKQLDSALEKSGIKEINPVGEKFDPHKHQAMTTVDSDKPPNTVVHVLQKGYLLQDRVLRPALVTVSKPKA
jgi:molecular chaperone GrpE